MDIAAANTLYWKLVRIIDPVLSTYVAPSELIDEKARRLDRETLAKGRAKAIMEELVAAGLVAPFIPSLD